MTAGTLARSMQKPDDAEADLTARRAITDLLGHTPVAVDELVRRSGAHPAVVAAVLLELERAGRVT